MRSFTKQFLIMALAVIIGMIVMGALGTWQIEQSVKTIKAASTALSVNNFILPHVQELASNEQLSRKHRELDGCH